MFKITKRDDKLIGFRKRSKFSKGELRIAKFLAENEVNFFPDFFFKELQVGGKTKLLFFDFYIPDYRLCIEFDGEQHYTRTFKGKKLINSERNDFLKNAFCKKKKLNLLRIKYTDIDNIEQLICERFDLMDKIKWNKKL